MKSEDRRPSASEEDEEKAEADKEKERAFAERRKQHYNEMAQIKKMMAAKALEEEDEDEDEDSEDEVPEQPQENGGYRDSDTVPTADVVAASCEASLDCEQAQNGQWAFGPDDLHGGPKLPGGRKFARETSQGSDARASSKEHVSEASGDVDADAPSACLLRGLEASRPALVGTDGIRRDKRPSGITWDEACIAEHDLERGTRQKIEEPNTPWIPSPELSNENTPGHGGTPDELENADSRHAGPMEEDVRKKLQCWYKQECHRASIQERLGEDVFKDVTVEDDDTAKKEEFANKRKNHYNEMDLVRKMMAAKLEDEEDEDDDDD